MIKNNKFKDILEKTIADYNIDINKCTNSGSINIYKYNSIFNSEFNKIIRISNNFMNFLYSLKDDINFSDIDFICFLTRSIIGNDPDRYCINTQKDILFDKLYSSLKSIKESNDGYILYYGDNQKMKFGKFLYKICHLLSIELNDNKINQIEKVVNFYKSWFNQCNKFKFVVLEGNDILKGYNRNFFINKREHMLNCSCMNDRLDFLDLYTKNSDKILMLSLQDDNGKIYGRSLIWNLDKPKNIFIDRIYGIDDSIYEIYRKFAEHNKFLYRSQTAGDFEIYYYNNDIKRYIYSYNEFLKLNIKLKSTNHKNYPYLDTFYIKDRITGNFMNYNKKLLFYQEFRSTRGYFSKKSNFLFDLFN